MNNDGKEVEVAVGHPSMMHNGKVLLVLFVASRRLFH
jgi:hypothetical protein